MEFGIVELSRLQFAMTAMYHFLFVPLTLGLSILVAIMETVYVMTNRPIWRQMTKFWGTLFGINFALGVATGITMEFQFGMNWSYYSHYVGDIFGAPLAIEGLMAFFLEATFVGLFFFGWDKLSKVAHLTVAWLVAIGSNFSALWILIANGWMQNPVGAEFNPHDHADGDDRFLCRPVQRSGAGEIRAYRQRGLCDGRGLRDRRVGLVSAERPACRTGPSVDHRCGGLRSGLGVFGRAAGRRKSGYSATHSQKMKLAAIEAMWETDPAPAPFNLIGFPDQEARETHYAIEIPWAMGLIGTRSLTTEIPGINDLVAQAETRIRSGIIAYDALMHIREQRDAADPAIMATFEEHSADLGFAFLLKKYVDDPRTATEEQIVAASNDTVPTVWPLFWAFRIMVALGLWLHRDDGLFLLPRVLQGHALSPLGPAHGGLDDPCAVDRGRAGLVRGRIRSPALDGGRRSAHGDVGQRPVDDRSRDDVGRFRPLLHRAVRHRDGPDAEIHPQRPVSGRRGNRGLGCPSQ